MRGGGPWLGTHGRLEIWGPVLRVPFGFLARVCFDSLFKGVCLSVTF